MSSSPRRRRSSEAEHGLAATKGPKDCSPARRRRARVHCIPSGPAPKGRKSVAQGESASPGIVVTLIQESRNGPTDLLSSPWLVSAASRTRSPASPSPGSHTRPGRQSGHGATHLAGAGATHSKRAHQPLPDPRLGSLWRRPGWHHSCSFPTCRHIGMENGAGTIRKDLSWQVLERAA